MAEQTSDLLGLIDDMDRLLRELNRRLSLPEGVQKSTYTKAGLENVRVRWYVLKGYLIAVEPLIEYRRKPPLLLNADYYIPSVVGRGAWRELTGWKHRQPHGPEPDFRQKYRDA